MLSIIIPEHHEGREWIAKMVSQVQSLDLLDREKSKKENINSKESIELIFVTSKSYDEFCNDVNYFDNIDCDNLSITIIPDVQSAGQARTIGGNVAKGDNLLYLDCHSCLDTESVQRLLDTLNDHPNAIVAPGYRWAEFPSCQLSGGMMYGLHFAFDKYAFEWRWIDAERTDKEFPVSMVCCCIISMKRDTFNVINEYGGFLGNDPNLRRIAWEEEISMRLWRLGHPTYSEPRCKNFGHYFKGHEGHKTWEQDFHIDEQQIRVIGIYINVFNPEVWDAIEKQVKKDWGAEKWDSYIDYAKKNYTWLRDKMEPFKDQIDENFFFKI